MMRRNHDYYRQWLHPERLAMRLIALTCAAARTSQSRAVIASKR
jgi:hypothetical protein